MNCSRILFSLILALIFQPFFAQTDTIVFQSTPELIDKANELHDQGEYDASINLLKKISPADPEYAHGLYEMALNYDYEGKPEIALKKLAEARFMGYEDPSLEGLEASIYDDIGNAAKGIEILEAALLKWPYNTNLLYNLGICYLNAGDPVKAEKVLIRNLRINPYHARTNLGLAHANMAMGRIAQAYLAYNMGILLSPSIGNLTDFENAITGRLKIISRPYLYAYPAEYDASAWNNLSDLMKSEFALKDDFAYPYKMNFTVCRQDYMLLQNIRYNPNDTSLYNMYYGKFFSDIVQSGYMDTYMYFILKNAGNDNVNKWLNDHSANIEAFVKKAQDLINQGRSAAFFASKLNNNLTYYHYDDNSNLESIGDMSSDIKNGRFIEVNKDGSINGIGNYVNNELQGEWLLLWTNGKTRQQLQYKDGTFEGVSYTYFPNGEKSGIYPMKGGVKDGVFEEYTSSGKLVSRNQYSNGIPNGPVIYHDYDENFVREFKYVNDTVEGRFTETFVDGVVKNEVNFVKGQYQGLDITRYPNGKTESETNYTNGTKTGKWSKYFFNGQLSETGEYDSEGLLTGKYISYDRNGKVISQTDHYEKGVVNGTLVDYYPDGGVKMRRYYSHDTLTRMQCFDGKGKLLYDQVAAGTRMNYRQYAENGVLLQEGIWNNGLWEGTVKKYNALGLLKEELNYEAGMLSGPQKQFFADGTLKESYTCDSNQVVGVCTTWFNNGHVESIGHYTKNGRNGELVYYFSNDTVSNRYFYTDNVLTGQEIAYAPDGKVHSIDFYDTEGKQTRSVIFDSTGAVVMDFPYAYGCHDYQLPFGDGKPQRNIRICDNKLDGVQEEYYPNGQLLSKINMNSGMYMGEVVRYDIHGKVQTRLNYLMGKVEGKISYYDDGKLSTESDYENGINEGQITSWYYNGNKQRVIEMSGNERNGYTWYYAPDGNLIYRLKFVEGQITGYSYLDKTGKILPDFPVTRDTREVIAYYPNGNVSTRFQLKDGIYEGSFRSYYNTGKPLRESEYKNDQNQGEEKNYYPNGKLREVVNYVNDDRSGPIIRYYENGTVKMTGYYIADKQYGQWHFYNVSGKETETVQIYNDDAFHVVTR